MEITSQFFKPRLFWFLVLLGSFALPVFAAAQIAVEFETGSPTASLFAESNFLPGDTVARWAELTNETPEPLPVGMAVTDFTDTDGLASQIDFTVKKGAVELFSGTLAEFAAFSEFTLDPALPGNSVSRFDFMATFKPSAGNEYQQASVSFNLVFGIITEEPASPNGQGGQGGPSLQSASSGGGGSASGITGSISGTLFNDANSNGVKDGVEVGLGGWIVYLDSNGNNLLDDGETDIISAEDGTYGFFSLPAGTYVVRTVLQDGWSFVVPNESAEFEYTVGVLNGAITDRNFGLLQGQVAGISDTVSFDDSGNLTNEGGEVLQAVDTLPKTGVSLNFNVFTWFIGFICCMFCSKQVEFLTNVPNLKS